MIAADDNLDPEMNWSDNNDSRVMLGFNYEIKEALIGTKSGSFGGAG